MRFTSLRPAFALVFALFAFTNCDCVEVIGKIPQPEVGILDAAGNVHKDQDPWMVIAFGDADTGQAITQNLQVKNLGGATLSVSQVCVVAAATLEAAVRADNLCLGSGATPFVFPLLIGTELGAGATADLPVTFRPTAGGPVGNLFLRVGSNAAAEPLAAVQLTGRGTDGALCADPVVDFGDVPVGTTVTRDVTVANCGIRPITIDTFALAANPDTAFGVLQGGVAPTPPIGPLAGDDDGTGGDSFVLTVSFTPTQPTAYRGARAGAIRMTTEAPFAGIYDIQLLGTGVEPPACRINVVPQQVNFGGVAANTTQTRQVIVQSVGQCACTLTGFAGPTPGDVGFAVPTAPALPVILKGTSGCADDPAGAAAAASSLSVDVTYTSPDCQNPVVDRATLEITTDAEVNPVRTVNLEANGGGAPICQLNVEPRTTSALSFGGRGRYGVVEFGRSSINIEKRLPIILENIGNTRCTISRVAYNDEENTLENEFRMENENGTPAPTTTPFFLEPGVQKIYTVIFAPTHTLESDNPLDVFSFGSYSASLSESTFGCNLFGTQCNGVEFVTDDLTTDVTGSTDVPGLFSIGFSATPVEPSVDILPPELDFGLVTLECGSPERRTTIYNTGALALKVGQPIVDPATTPPTFAVTATSNPGDNPTNATSGWPFTLEPGQSMSIAVRYFARAEGVQSGVLIVPTFEDDNGNAVDGPPLTVPLRGEGTVETSTVDIFDQARDPTVDVLFVVDDSGSMSDDQAQLAQNFPQFFTSSNVDDADYHIAVTTSLTVGPNCVGIGGQTCADDPMSGHYTVGADGNDRFLTPASTDAQGQFGENVLVSNRRIPDRPTSDGGEGALRSAYNFLSAPKDITDPLINGGFLRDNAKLHVIMVSDEPDQSRGPTDLYIDFFQNLKGFRNSSLVAVSAIALRDNETCPSDPQNVGSARYEEVVTALNGRFQSLCEQDWTGSMRALGLDSLGLQVEFFLTRAATEATLTVCVRDGSTTAACQPATQVAGPGANGYFYDDTNNSIVFNPGSVPGRGSRVEARYEAFCFAP